MRRKGKYLNKFIVTSHTTGHQFQCLEEIFVTEHFIFKNSSFRRQPFPSRKTSHPSTERFRFPPVLWLLFQLTQHNLCSTSLVFTVHVLTLHLCRTAGSVMKSQVGRTLFSKDKTLLCWARIVNVLYAMKVFEVWQHNRATSESAFSDFPFENPFVF